PILSYHTMTTEIATLSLHDALPIFAIDSPGTCRARTDLVFDLDVHGSIHWRCVELERAGLLKRILRSERAPAQTLPAPTSRTRVDRKSTRLNSSHVKISYAVFCLKK